MAEDFDEAAYLADQVEQARQRAVLAFADAEQAKLDAQAAEAAARDWANKGSGIISQANQAVLDAQAATLSANEAAAKSNAKDLKSSPLGIGSDYGIVFSDELGSVAGGVLESGTFNFETPPLVQRQPGATFQPVIAPGWATVFADAAGNVALGVTDTGEVVVPKLNGGVSSPELPAIIANNVAGLSKSTRNKVSAIGDSLTQGYFGGSGGKTADAWPARLATLVGGTVEVTNLAYSGYAVDEESIRIGALPVPLTVTGGSIPASGAVTVTTTAVIGWRDATTTRNFTGFLAGIPGTLTKTTSSTDFTFTRAAAGAVTPVPAGTVFVSDFAGHDAETLVIMIGHNNAAYNAKGPDASVAEHVSKGIKRIAAWHSRQVKQILVMSVTTKNTWTSGTAGYLTVQAINAQLEADWGTRYYDLRRYLVNQAIYDLGITPTSDDLASMAADTLPTSIMDPGDVTHYSKATAALVGERVYEYLITRDWITQ